MGERIQELRKEKGLSQEALGDALGVSRQAISKWEADAAIPEVEKLVAMSRLFGVSVGAILGVEPETEPEKELTDRELRAVETIVSRYVAEAERRRPRRKKWPWVLLVLAIVIFVIVVAAQFSRMNESIRTLRNEVGGISYDVSREISSITHRVETILERQDSLIADSGNDIVDILPLENRICVEVYATPKQYVHGMTARFVAESEAFGVIAQEGVAEDTTFTAVLQLPPVEYVRLKVIFDDGTHQTTQLLDEIYGLDTMTSIDMDGSYRGQVGPVSGGMLSFNGQVDIYAHTPDARYIEITDLQVCVRQNGKDIETIPLAEHCFNKQSYLWTADVDFVRNYPVTDGDRIDLVCRGQDNFGRWHEEVFQSAAVAVNENGILTLLPDVPEEGSPSAAVPSPAPYNAVS